MSTASEGAPGPPPEVDERPVEEIVERFRRETGTLPPHLALLAEVAPSSLQGHDRMWRELMRDPSEGGALPKRYKALLCASIAMTARERRGRRVVVAGRRALGAPSRGAARGPGLQHHRAGDVDLPGDRPALHPRGAGGAGVGRLRARPRADAARRDPGELGRRRAAPGGAAAGRAAGAGAAPRRGDGGDPRLLRAQLQRPDAGVLGGARPGERRDAGGLLPAPALHDAPPGGGRPHAEDRPRSSTPSSATPSWTTPGAARRTCARRW